ncbi:uncharacterized protein CLUP02_06370 [Colletotrichum lupini]|uniref:Uncharacterized protein n=1 Tax=Colletotrichum lupini TaxID=145971 RepID=A0A9Q8WFN1_9PEZI|nr:uncharacterized protein CLUP02_06370 [Colletotrichum lupini]UQC80885.1 hypothetical protein CLUP02_06370 [Colletotrichum lupini]
MTSVFLITIGKFKSNGSHYQTWRVKSKTRRKRADRSTLMDSRARCESPALPLGGGKLVVFVVNLNVGDYHSVVFCRRPRIGLRGRMNRFPRGPTRKFSPTSQSVDACQTNFTKGVGMAGQRTQQSKKSYPYPLSAS